MEKSEYADNKSVQRKQHIESVIRNSEKVAGYCKELVQAYEEYMHSDEDLKEEFCEKATRFCTVSVRRRVSGGRYAVCRNEWEHIVQESVLALWQKVEKTKKENCPHGNIAALANSICRSEAANAVRKTLKLKDPETREGYVPISIETPTGDGTTTIADNISDDSRTETERGGAINFSVMVILLYLRALVNLQVEPQKCLALFYSRILSHERESVDDNITTSVRTALRVMNEKTVGVLADESERIMQSAFSKKLRWNSNFRAQLEEIVETRAGEMPLKCVVFTRAYTTSEIEHWSTAVHKECVKKVSETAQNNEGLRNMAEKHLPQYLLSEDGKIVESIVYKVLTGGRV